MAAKQGGSSSQIENAGEQTSKRDDFKVCDEFSFSRIRRARLLKRIGSSAFDTQF